MTRWVELESKEAPLKPAEQLQEETMSQTMPLNEGTAENPPIETREVGIVTCFRAVPLREVEEMEASEEPRVRESSSSQPSKARSPMAVRESGKVMEVDGKH